MPFSTIIYDEIHLLASHTAQRSKAALKLKADRIYGLSATLVNNSAIDIYMPLTIIRPGLLGNWWSFMQRYVVRNNQGWILGSRNMEELGQKIAPFIIRKTLEEVSMQLPEITTTDLTFELSEEEKKIATQIKKELLFDIEQHYISKIKDPVNLQLPVVKFGKLQELVNSLELIGEGTKSTKLELLKEHLTTTITGDAKAVIFSRFERMVQILARELAEYNPLVITGAVDNRQAIIDSFQNDDKHRIILMTEAGGLGINLFRANIMYHYDQPFSIGKHTQRTGRIYRNGQEKPVFVYNLIGNKTIDSVVLKKLAKKQEVSDVVLGQADLVELFDYDIN